MKVKSKLWAALGTFMDHTTISKAATTDRSILTNIETAILRCTDRHDMSIDDKYVHEILFLVSNAPGSITFLSRRISIRLDSMREPMVALKCLVLLHRLLRGGDRYFEQDLRNLWSSRNLRLDLSWCLDHSDDLHAFLRSYSSFLEERMGWFINQAGNLEPSRPSSIIISQSYEEEVIELLIFRLSKCQDLLDRVLDCSLIDISSSGQVIQSAISIILRESFRVYESFREGIEDMVRSSFDLHKALRVPALNILEKACTQTTNLQEFYHNCKRSIVGKSLDYPFVKIITLSNISAMEQFLPTGRNLQPSAAPEDDRIKEGKIAREEAAIDQNNLFSGRLETTISTVWVEFDEENSQTSNFSFAESNVRSVGAADNIVTKENNSSTRQATALL
ncbi:putative clathrin assembly protein At1g33340 [Typha latifolia]|uniref:putative clathrin assembly protein At1g33340 n=1 Tax=Typha latifolia TaxID=4733 RepID=UPI003C2EB931